MLQKWIMLYLLISFSKPQVVQASAPPILKQTLLLLMPLQVLLDSTNLKAVQECILERFGPATAEQQLRLVPPGQL